MLPEIEKKGENKLILPNLIFGILVLQGFKPSKNEIFEAFKETIKVDVKLISGAHFLDLNGPNPRNAPAEEEGEPSTSNSKRMMLAYCWSRFDRESLEGGGG